MAVYNEVHHFGHHCLRRRRNVGSDVDNDAKLEDADNYDQGAAAGEVLERDEPEAEGLLQGVLEEGQDGLEACAEGLRRQERRPCLRQGHSSTQALFRLKTRLSSILLNCNQFEAINLNDDTCSLIN